MKFFSKDKIIPATLETERFVLRRVTTEQLARCTFSWTRDSELMHSLGFTAKGWTPKTWRKSFKHLRKENGFCWLIYPKGVDSFIGYQSVHISKNGPGFLTVAIEDRSWWGKQVVVETRAAICHYMFTETPCPRLYGTPRSRNLPSVFNYQSLGFKAEGVMRNHTIDHEKGEMADVIIFGLLRDEWTNNEGRTAPKSEEYVDK